MPSIASDFKATGSIAMLKIEKQKGHEYETPRHFPMLTSFNVALLIIFSHFGHLLMLCMVCGVMWPNDPDQRPGESPKTL
jgi:hypothetical protein